VTSPGTSPGSRSGESAYRDAGVDVAAGQKAVSLFRDTVAGASRPEVMADGSLRSFAGLFDLGDGRYLAAGTDGVGTKLEVARLLGRLDTVGIDLVAMCANDVVCTGAEPLFFLDYLAVEDLVPEDAAAIVSGVAAGCVQAGCALLGGETAEHPGTMGEGRFDLAGFCVGVVQHDAILRPDDVRPGDALIGLRSSGVHSNGFSLIRRALLPGADDTAVVKILDEFVPALGRTLGDELLEPTTIYVRTVLALMRDGLIRSAAHITGGGWFENVPRALPEGLGAEIRTDAWDPHPIFGVIADAAGLTKEDLFGVLNMGTGMVLAVPAGEESRAVDACRASGSEATVVGRVIEAAGVHLA
jgi:phosphoribosylformylglycinamidine cyclo-ligase